MFSLRLRNLLIYSNLNSIYVYILKIKNILSLYIKKDKLSLSHTHTHTHTHTLKSSYDDMLSAVDDFLDQ